MTLEEFANRVEARKNPGQNLDPMTIMALIAAAIQVAKMIRDCYLEWKKKEIVEAYRSWTPLGWLRRRRVRHAVEAEKLDASYGEAIVAELADVSDTSFLQLMKNARLKGGF